MHSRLADREIDRLIAEHYGAIARRIGGTWPPGRVEGRPSGRWRAVASSAGLAAAAALCLWVTAEGIGRSSLADEAARFVADREVSLRIADGLEWLGPVLARAFGTGGNRP